MIKLEWWKDFKIMFFVQQWMNDTIFFFIAQPCVFQHKDKYAACENSKELD